MSYDQKILSKRLWRRTRSDIPIRHNTCSLSCPTKGKVRKFVKWVTVQNHTTDHDTREVCLWNRLRIPGYIPRKIWRRVVMVVKNDVMARCGWWMLIGGEWWYVDAVWWKLNLVIYYIILASTTWWHPYQESSLNDASKVSLGLSGDTRGDIACGGWCHGARKVCV